MTNNEIRALYESIKPIYFDLKSSNRIKFLKQLTDDLKLKDNLQWQKVCLTLNPYEAIKYLDIKDLDLKLSYDGRTLLQFKPEDITLQKIERAMHAHIPLTIPMIRNSKVIKGKLTNKFIYKQATYKDANNTLCFNLHWLPLWNKKGLSLPKICNTKNVVELNSLFGKNNYMNLLTNPKLREQLDNLNLPKTFFNTLNYIYERYKKYCEAWKEKASQRERIYGSAIKSIDFALSEDPVKNEIYFGMLRMTGALNKYYNTESNVWKTERYYVYALLYCMENEMR